MNWLQVFMLIAGISALVLYGLIAVSLVVCIVILIKYLIKRPRSKTPKKKTRIENPGKRRK